MSQRQEKVAELIKELSAVFLEREGNNTSLITVTSATCSPDLKNGTVYITVLPEDKEISALAFVKRKRKDLRDYFKKNMNTKSIPFIDIKIDQGEKNRQKIDELLRKS